MEKETERQKVANQRGWDYLKKLGYSWQRPRLKHKKALRSEQETFIKSLPNVVKEVKEQYQGCEVDTWFVDEHRIGLKPILRKVWSPLGERPTAIVSYRYEWLYIYGFVNPKTGENLWSLIPRVNTKWLNLVYESFSKDVGISENKNFLLFQDNTGWHRSQKVIIPEGMTIKFLPAYSPELQPAERLWSLVDEPVVNKYFENIEELESVLLERCLVLSEMKEEIKKITYYHWLHRL